MKISQQRQRAIEIATKDINEDGYASIDYAIDDVCRSVLNLPDRPLGGLPYVRWMNVSKPAKDDVMRISQAGIDLIKRWEGFRGNAYLCPAGVWTIGYGHTGNVKQGQRITRQRGEELLLRDLERFERGVRDNVRVPLTQNQYDALVSFAYNVGVQAFKKSTLLKYLNKAKYRMASIQFHRWTFAGGRKLDGLIARRNAEYDLFIG